MILQSVWVPNVGRVSDPLDRKYCVLGHTKLLFETPMMVAAPYASFWMPLFSAMILLLSGETNDSATPEFDEEVLGLEEMGGTSNVFARLIYSSENFGTAFQEVNEARAFLSSLQAFTRTHPGWVRKLWLLEVCLANTVLVSVATSRKIRSQCSGGFRKAVPTERIRWTLLVNYLQINQRAAFCNNECIYKFVQ